MDDNMQKATQNKCDFMYRIVGFGLGMETQVTSRPAPVVEIAVAVRGVAIHVLLLLLLRPRLQAPRRQNLCPLLLVGVVVFLLLLVLVTGHQVACFTCSNRSNVVLIPIAGGKCTASAVPFALTQSKSLLEDCDRSR